MFRIALISLSFLALAGESAMAAGGASPSRGGGAEKRITSAESYVPIYGLAAAVMEDYAPVGLLTVDLGLDVPDPALRARAQRMGPRLRDAARAALSQYAFSRYQRDAAPDADQLARMLQRNVDQTLGAPGAKVLLANVMIQRRR